MPCTLLWFRNDLRLADNPALVAACSVGNPVIPVFVWAPEEEDPWQPGAASRWWLHQSLDRLQESLCKAGSRLIIRKGPTLSSLQAIIRQCGVDRVLWNRSYVPACTRRDAEIKQSLRANGLHVESFAGALLHEPWDISNQSRQPFQVFTPFWKACLLRGEPDAPLAAPPSISAPDKWPCSLQLVDLALEPAIDWAGGLRAAWVPGESGAVRQLGLFLETALPKYATARDLPAAPGTSRLSPPLHFGEISPRQVWQAVQEAASGGKDARSAPQGRWGNAADTYLREIGWREFAQHLLFHFPHTADQPLRGEFAAFPWRTDTVAMRAWETGRTGYPIVDAGMRELWTTGWMHNRVRMIVASFLVKHLLLPWQDGANWFWDTLVDADLASNTLGWQWSAGCGADAAPYFRIFNPVLQGEKFDAQGLYVRRWVPELAGLPDEWIHQTWNAPTDVLSRAGVTLGRNYPNPIVEHAFARQRALAALQRIKK